MEYQDVDYQTAFNILIAIAGFLGGWILNSLKSDIIMLTKDVKEIEVLVAGTYVKRDDMDKLGAAIFHKLDRIEAKLDQKADK